jgi:hypothetical protein|tara:strand:- start:45 stop:314 length:270 start_codon:yes stop_codon:yes gene_type:complete
MPKLNQVKLKIFSTLAGVIFTTVLSIVLLSNKKNKIDLIAKKYLSTCFVNLVNYNGSFSILYLFQKIVIQIDAWFILGIIFRLLKKEIL